VAWRSRCEERADDGAGCQVGRYGGAADSDVSSELKVQKELVWRVLVVMVTSGAAASVIAATVTAYFTRPQAHRDSAGCPSESALSTARAFCQQAGVVVEMGVGVWQTSSAQTGGDGGGVLAGVGGVRVGGTMVPLVGCQWALGSG
jgi:hypothetical protein